MMARTRPKPVAVVAMALVLSLEVTVLPPSKMVMWPPGDDRDASKGRNAPRLLSMSNRGAGMGSVSSTAFTRRTALWPMYSTTAGYTVQPDMPVKSRPSDSPLR